VVAPSPEKHPAYVHALADLRNARAYLAKPAGAQVKWDENRAIRELDAAINEIHKASIQDGASGAENAAVDVGMVWGDRLHKARELSEAARRDVNQEEDNAWASGLKNRALGHIDLAVRAIDDGIADASHGPPPPPVVVVEPPPAAGAHPAYLHALSDLRMARALLEKPARPEVKWDEMNGVREIDAAIKEIRDAAIDDNKPVNEHPPIDAKWGHKDRLREASRLLQQASRDIQEKEDNAFAKGLRKRAVDHIANAIHAVAEGIEDRREEGIKEKKHGH
jgi:hypothetical protein